MKYIILPLFIFLSTISFSQANLPAVYVEWEDIIATNGEWRSPGEAKAWNKETSGLVHQLGFIVAKNEDYVILTESYMGDSLLGYCVRIPVGNIRTFVMLKK